ncbi:MAG: LytR family transcriptional regulator [Ruminococcaceae bacterium]|nr:LytR family transcriptional regulator [Oscillospiraceae bacterium]
MAGSRLRPRQRKLNKTQSLLIAVALILALLLLGYFLLFREPEQKPQLPQDMLEEVMGSGDLTEEEVEALRSHYERKNDFYTILLSGVDSGSGGSDTNILVAVDAGSDRIYGVSIPRDTKAIINGKERKLNAAYAIGGMELLAEVVSEQLGVPVDYTVKVDLKGFEALVDEIGGVEFNIPIDMDYDDPYQDLSIHFTKGVRHLNGEEALKVIRFRHNNDGTGYGSEDIGRMRTQQNFLKSVAKQTLTVSNLGKIDEFVKIFKAYVETDLTIRNLAWLGKEAISIGSDNLEFSTLPGQWENPYIHLDREATLQLINEHLNPYVEDRRMEDLKIPS